MDFFTTEKIQPSPVQPDVSSDSSLTARPVAAFCESWGSFDVDVLPQIISESL